MRVQARNITIDILKGICIILMVIGHSGAPQWLKEGIYMFHMPCFFIISGYLFNEKYLYDIKNFLSRKVQTLWKPFVIWTLIFLALHNIFADLYLYKDSYSLTQHLKYAVQALLMRKSEQLLGGFWFLIALLFASTVSILWYKTVKFSKSGIFGGMFTMLAVSFALLYLKVGIWYFSYINFLATAYFMLGTLLRLTLFSNIAVR